MEAAWAELYPDRAWPGWQAAVSEMIEEIHSLRLLTDTIVTSALELEGPPGRSQEEIQRAHDLVGQYAFETGNGAVMSHVSALCWVLRHDHNTEFGRILTLLEARLAELGIEVVRLPNPQQRQG